jgi:hypothetical protein
VQTSSDATKAVLMAPGAVTHANDMSQRHVPLAVTASGAGTLTVNAPASAELAPPTYYMLFVLNDAGVPSVAKFIRLKLGRDNPPPDTLINSAPAPESQSASATFEFDSTRPGSTFECRRDGGAPVPCTSPWSYSGLSDGPHSFEVTAVDAHGKPDPTPATRSWIVQTSSSDDVPPETSIVSGPSLSTGSSSAAGAGDTSAPDSTPPAVDMLAANARRAVRQRRIVVELACPTEACTATAGGRLVVARGAAAFNLRPASAQIARGGRATLELRFSKKVSRIVRRALVKRLRVRVNLVTSARDAAGNHTTRRSSIRLRS